MASLEHHVSTLNPSTITEAEQNITHSPGTLPSASTPDALVGPILNVLPDLTPSVDPLNAIQVHFDQMLSLDRIATTLSIHLTQHRRVLSRPWNPQRQEIHQAVTALTHDYQTLYFDAVSLDIEIQNYFDENGPTGTNQLHPKDKEMIGAEMRGFKREMYGVGRRVSNVGTLWTGISVGGTTA